MAVCQQHHRDRSDVARVHLDCRRELFHRVDCHFAEWSGRRLLPCFVSRHCPSQLGVLGLLHCYRVTCDFGYILVRNSDTEWSEHGACDAGRDLAQLFDAAERHSRESGNRDEYHGLLSHILDRSDPFLIHASEQSALAVHGQVSHRANCLDRHLDLGFPVYWWGWRRHF